MLNQQWVLIADSTNVLSAVFSLSALGSIHFSPNWGKVITNWHVHLVTTFESIQESLKELWLYAGSLGSAGCK
jgi:hypothetical protein